MSMKTRDEMDTQLLPAIIDNRTTEPMPVVRIDSPELCGVDGCDKPATPLVYCQSCKRPLCRQHIEIGVANGAGRVTCPAHKGGE
jgi:hypothetical protein